MQRKSLFALTWMIATLPAAFACTVTVTDGDDEDAGPSTSEEETTTGETTGNEDAGTPTDTATSDTSAPDTDSGVPDTNTGDAGEEPAGDGGSTADAGEEPVDEDGGTSGDAGEEPAPEGDAAAPSGDEFKSGSITLSQTITTVPIEIISTLASASFSKMVLASEPGSGGAECETETVDGCTLTVCDVSGVDPDTEQPQITTVSAGDVTITGLAQEVTLTPSDDGTYTPATGTARIWEGGETVIATAEGSDEVPGFSIELTAPSAVTVSEPALSFTAATEVSRAADLSVAWSEGDVGNVSVSLLETSTGDITRSISCAASVASGGVTIASELLESFEGQGMLSVSIAAAQAQTAEEWSLSLSATGSLGNGLVEFTD